MRIVSIGINIIQNANVSSMLRTIASSDIDAYQLSPLLSIDAFAEQVVGASYPAARQYSTNYYTFTLSYLLTVRLDRWANFTN